MVDSKGESQDSLTNALRTIRTYWADLRPLLEGKALARLADAFADRDEDPVIVAREVRSIIKSSTPPDHPARPALLPSGHRLAPSLERASEVAMLVAELNALFESSRPKPDPIRHGMDRPRDPEQFATPSPEDEFVSARGPDYIPDERDQWLLDEPSFSVSAIRWDESWADHIVVLHSPNGVPQVPAFQFDGPESSPGTPRRIVLEVNRDLSADADPWGVADWWLGSNVLLPVPPARLLGTKNEDRIKTALRAALSEW